MRKITLVVGFLGAVVVGIYVNSGLGKFYQSEPIRAEVTPKLPITTLIVQSEAAAKPVLAKAVIPDLGRTSSVLLSSVSSGGNTLLIESIDSNCNVIQDGLFPILAVSANKQSCRVRVSYLANLPSAVLSRKGPFPSTLQYTTAGGIQGSPFTGVYETDLVPTAFEDELNAPPFVFLLQPAKPAASLQVGVSVVELNDSPNLVVGLEPPNFLSPCATIQTQLLGQYLTQETKHNTGLYRSVASNNFQPRGSDYGLEFRSRRTQINGLEQTLPYARATWFAYGTHGHPRWLRTAWMPMTFGAFQGSLREYSMHPELALETSGRMIGLIQGTFYRAQIPYFAGAPEFWSNDQVLDIQAAVCAGSSCSGYSPTEMADIRSVYGAASAFAKESMCLKAADTDVYAGHFSAEGRFGRGVSAFNGAGVKSLVWDNAKKPLWLNNGAIRTSTYISPFFSNYDPFYQLTNTSGCTGPIGSFQATINPVISGVQFPHSDLNMQYQLSASQQAASSSCSGWPSYSQTLGQPDTRLGLLTRNAANDGVSAQIRVSPIVNIDSGAVTVQWATGLKTICPPSNFYCSNPSHNRVLVRVNRITGARLTINGQFQNPGGVPAIFWRAIDSHVDNINQRGEYYYEIWENSSTTGTLLATSPVIFVTSLEQLSPSGASVLLECPNNDCTAVPVGQNSTITLRGRLFQGHSYTLSEINSVTGQPCSTPGSLRNWPINFQALTSNLDSSGNITNPPTFKACGQAGRFIYKLTGSINNSVQSTGPMDVAGSPITYFDGAPPASPTNLIAAATVPASALGYRLNWQQNWNGISGTFEVQSQVQPSGTWNLITSNPPLTALQLLGNVTSSGTYLFRVRACRSGSCSSWVVSQAIDLGEIVSPAPAAPTNVIATATSPGTRDYRVTWNHVSAVGTSFNVETSANNQQSWAAVGTSLSTLAFSDTASADGSYFFRVRACVATVCSAWVATPQALGLPQLPTSQPATPPTPHFESIGSSNAGSDSVGATPGDFRVDEGGAASYSLPIMSLPGTAGLSPKLSLDYSARGAVGALGTGFVLSGQSAFSRCKRTVEAGDGAGPHPSVDYADVSDIAYCMDGQRIFSVADTCPALTGIASTGRPFRSELDPSTRICGYSNVSNTAETDFWLVFPKDGTMRRYGYAGNSSLRPNDGLGNALAVGYAVQALDRIADITGNTVDFIYSGDLSTGELLLSEARYTGKVANRLDMAASYSREPFARTQFIYSTLPVDEQRIDYFAGSRSLLTKRLDEVNVFGPANNGSNAAAQVHARRYQLQYATATSGSRMPRLVAVRECTPATTAGSTDVCYPPTRFSWNNTTDNDFPEGFTAPPTLSNYSDQLRIASDFKIGEINGDGRQDLVFLKDRDCEAAGADRVSGPQHPDRFRLMVAISNGTGLNAPIPTDVFLNRKPYDELSPTLPFYGRRYSYTPCSDNQAGAVRIEVRRQSNDEVLSTPAIFWSLAWHLFDLSGDGRDDLIAQRPKQLVKQPGFGFFVHRTTQNAAQNWRFDSASIDLSVDAAYDRDSSLADFTGDGLPDLVLGSPGPNLNNAVRALKRLNDPASNQAFAFESQDRTVTFVGFEPNANLSFGSGNDGRDALASGDLTGDGVADLVLKVYKVRTGIQCIAGTCQACGGKNQPECTDPGGSSCSQVNAACLQDRSDVLGLGPQPRWQNAARAEAAFAPNNITTVGDYWVTAKVTQVGNEFVVNAGQCIGSGNNVAFCDSQPNLEGASLADINGDGMADVFMRHISSDGGGANQNDRFAYRLNRGGNNVGTSLLAEQDTGLILRKDLADRVQLIDTNGDKRTDLVYQSACTSSFCTLGANPLKMRRYLSSGFAFEQDAATGSPAVLGGQNPNEFLVLPLDLDGDGNAELLRYKIGSATQNLYVVKSNLRFGGNDFIVKLSNGFNVDHSVSYAPLVSKFVYERAFDGPRLNSGRGSVVFDVFSPLWAVREARSSSPGCAPDAINCVTDDPAALAATSIIRYSYRGARVQTGGRGFLGFSEIRTEDIQNKLLTTTRYRQDYPYVGRPFHTIVQTLPSVILDETCLINPLHPSCFEEPPDDCGPNICPIAESRAPRVEVGGVLTRVASPAPYRFMSTEHPIITDSTSVYTSNPVFNPVSQLAIAVYSNSQTELRKDFATQSQTQRILTTMTMDTQSNMTEQKSTTFDAADTEVESKRQWNVYGCTDAPVQLVLTGANPNCGSPGHAERLRLGRMSLSSVSTARGGITKNRRSSFEYDSTTFLLIAEVQGLYNYGAAGEPPVSDQARFNQRTDYELDANGNRTLSVTCNVSDYANRTACLNLTQFQQQQWPATPTRFQRYTRMEYDPLGRFMTGSRSPYYSASNVKGVEAYNERSGVTQSGALNFNVYGDPLGALTAHGVFAEKFYGPMGREYFARAATGAFSRSTYAWCVDASSTTMPDGSGGIPSAASRVNCPRGALYRIESNTSEGNLNIKSIAPTSFAYFDKLGRNILSTTRLYQSAAADSTGVNRWTSSYTRYDLLGRVKAKSEPYLSKVPTALQSQHRAGDRQLNAVPGETRTTYDPLGRSSNVVLPSEAYNNGLTETSATFDRMRTTSKNPRQNQSIIDKNGLAEATLATDAANFSVAYRYEAHGNMDRVTRTPNDGNSAGQPIITAIDYDLLGRKLIMVDPDKGTISYSYNALGELLTQTDAKIQTQSLFYDALGRLIERRENRKLANGTFQNEPTARWIYDDANLVGTAQKAIGLLISETNGLAGTGEFTRGYSYDAFGRSAVLATNLEGTQYFQRTTYDQYGRVFQSFDASINASSPNGQLQIYSSDGYPIEVKEASNGMIGQVYSEVLALTARQQVRKERYHGTDNLVSDRTFEDNTGRLAAITAGINGSLQKWNFRWDKNGSLSERADTTNGADWKEEFVYDTLDRLTTVKQTRTNGTVTNIDSLVLAYDQLGNITSKTGAGQAVLGAYQYKSATSTTGCANVSGPHAASLVNGKSYCYDLNGNNTEVRKNGAVIRTIVYTGFDLAESVVRDEMTPEGRIQAQVSFQYGTDRAMFKRVDGASGSSGAKTTFYVGNVEFIREGITSSTKRYIGNYLVVTKIGGQPESFDYLLRDSLGSVDTIASETGVMKSRQSFNAHGQRRTAAAAVTTSWTTLSLFQASQFNTSTTTQGFTGHEQLDQVGLVHMNARLYDPELGRFIQADDFVEPEATQGLNRYSYVLNNPLSATDPSGNFSLRQALGVVVGVIAAITGQWYFAHQMFLKSFLVAVAGGFASAAISTGSLKAGLWGAVSAAAFWGIGTGFAKMTHGVVDGKYIPIKALSTGARAAKIAAHAAPGGTLNALQGGKFGHGFIAAGFTEALSPAVGQIKGDGFGSVLARTAVSAAIGGTASKLSGGSFANGAQMGAFQQLFNACVHPSTLKKTLTASGPKGQSNADIANEAWASSGAVSINAEGKLVVNLKYHSDLSASLTKTIIADIKQYWRYRTDLTLTRVSDPAEANYFLTDGTAEILAITCGVQSSSAWIPAKVDHVGGSTLMVNLLPQGNYGLGTFAHEFGHNLGLHHDPAGSKSMMSYDPSRSVKNYSIGSLKQIYGAGK